jgi:hypothetical protein
MAKILDKMTRWSESVIETLEGKCFDLGYVRKTALFT